MPNLLIQPAPVPSWGLAQQRAAQTRGMQNQNLLAERQMQDYPEEQAWKRESRQADRDEREYTKHLRDFKTSMEPLVKMEAVDKMLRIVSNKTTLSNHDAVTANVYRQLNISPEQAQAGQSAAQIAEQARAAGQDPETYYQTVYKPKQLMTWEQKFELMKEEITRKPGPYGKEATAFERTKAEIKKEFSIEKWSAPKAGVDESGKQVFFQTNDKGESRLVSGVQPEPKKGMKVTTPDGTVVEIGGTGTSDMTPKSKGAIEEKITSGKEQVARMQTIYQGFKPEYQEIGTRLGSAWTGIKAKLGQNVSQKDAEQLTEFKKFQRKSIENINLYIKELTGAQMSEKEADRLRLAQPDPGEKWYSGDDPITFKAKMDDVLKYSRASVARYEYYRSKGFGAEEIKKIVKSETGISLEDIASRMK